MDTSVITAIIAGVVALGQIWANYQLAKIHKLTNSNFNSQQDHIAAQAVELKKLNELLVKKL